MLVQGYPPDFRIEHADESEESDFAPSPVTSNGEQHLPDPTDHLHHHPQSAADDLEEAQRARRFTRAVSRDLEERLVTMGQRWRERLLRDKQRGARAGYVARPPTLYAFAVIQHIVMLASHDAGSASNPVVVLDQVRLNERGQWLWNALSLALPVNMARDTLVELEGTGVVVGLRGEDYRMDPDL
jgi:hypothetical protein